MFFFDIIKLSSKKQSLTPNKQTKTLLHKKDGERVPKTPSNYTIIIIQSCNVQNRMI